MSSRGGGLHLRDGILVAAYGDGDSVEFSDPDEACAHFAAIEATDRSHVQWYATDLETVWRWLFVESRETVARCGKESEPMWSASYMTAAHWRRTHFRDVRSWTLSGPKALCEEFGADCPARALAMWRGRVSGIVDELGGKMRGTSSATGHDLWRLGYNETGAWRSPLETEDADWIRRAYYGGRTTPHVLGIVARDGHVPRRLAQKTRAPVVVVPPGMRLWRIDQSSAYPYAMAGRLPWVWGAAVEHWDRTVPNAIVEATVRVGSPDCLPLRIKCQARGWRTIWCRPGHLARGVWTATTLREAERLGCAVVKVHRARSWLVDYRPFGSLPDTVWRAAARLPRGPTRDSIKSLTRRLYGRLGISRFRYRWMPLSEYLESDIQVIPRYHVGRWVYVGCKDDEYPAYSQPAWAAEITSRVNVTLGRVERALQEGGLPVYYSDTDSVLFAAPEDPRAWSGIALPPDVARRMDEKLGSWRVDWRGDWALILGPKWYALSGGRTALAGVPHALQQDVLQAQRFDR